jgi:purine nucleosidase
MGGAIAEGNVTPAAEFNIYVDPHAARIVFGCGSPIAMFPLDCTHKALTSRARVERIRSIGSRTALAVAEWLDFFERFDQEKYGTEGGPLHDPCVIAYLLEPAIFSGRKANVEIETESELTAGATVVDWWGVTDRRKNAWVAGGLDADALFHLIHERIARL